jgi:hypothetical protein
MVVRPVRLLRGACGVSTSDLGLVAKVVYLYPHFFYETVGLFIRIPHGDGYKVFQSPAAQQLSMVDGSSSPFSVKMVPDVHSSLMMHLRVGAGHEIL